MQPTLDDLNTNDYGRLRARYTELFGRPPPAHASRGFLQGNIAWATQAMAVGRDPQALLDELTKPCTPPRKPRKRRFRAGTRLIREWHGVRHEVLVTDDGFRYRETLYPHLTAIALEITGTRWSGPRFFGVKR